MIDVALAALVIALVLMASEWLQRYYLSIPMVLVLAGLVLGQYSLGWLELAPDAEITKQLTELTLGLLLFASASRIRLRAVIAERELEARLLTIGLLGSVLLGTVITLLLFAHADLGLALLLGAALAPTDAALGLPIFHNHAIPSRIRQSLDVESGLNDGIVTPIVTLAIALAIAEGAAGDEPWLGSALSQIAIALAVGVAVGLVGGTLLNLAVARGWTSKEASQIAFLSLALVAFYGSRNLEGNGFIAAFVAGAICGSRIRSAPRETADFAEAAGNSLSLGVWLIFGASILPLALDEFFDWRAVVFSLLALTVMRMLPVAIAMLGTGMRTDTVGIMGWFGPRGLASIVFLITAFVAFEEAGESSETLIAAATWTIFLSVILHGITATPLGDWYGRRLATADPAIPEFEEPAGVDAYV